MINWNSVFQETAIESQAVAAEDQKKKSELLEKLFEANKGMAKLTGQDSQELKDYMQSDEYLNLMNSKPIDTTPRIVGANDGEGRSIENYVSLSEVQEMMKEIVDEKFKGMTLFNTW
jgi:hypothetical protein